MTFLAELYTVGTLADDHDTEYDGERREEDKHGTDLRD